jgi:hypothetical protein
MVSGVIRFPQGCDARSIAHEMGHGLHENLRHNGFPDRYGEDFAEAICWFVEERLPGASRWCAEFQQRAQKGDALLRKCDYDLEVFKTMLVQGTLFDEAPPVRINEAVHFTEQIGIEVRYYLSLNHIQAAAHFARQSKRIQSLPDYHTLSAPEQQDRIAEHRAYVIGSILSSVCFLEAAINELFADAAGHTRGWVNPLGADVLKLIASRWTVEKLERSARLLEKYEIGLSLAAKPPFDRGAAPYQDVRDLVLLRNALVHAKPESVTTVSEMDPTSVDVQRLEKLLRAKNFAMNPFLNGLANPFFPDKCLGHGCARWGVASAFAFADEFFSRLGLTPVYDGFRSSLGVE